MSWHANPDAHRWACEPAPAGVGDFHRQLPGYAPTPLADVPGLAAELGVGRVLVKDESGRLGLPAFKVLGASWAVGRLLAGPDPTLAAVRAAARTRPITLVTATDGNHGRAVARLAAMIGAAARVLVPATVPARAVALIAGEGATVTTVDGSYDEAVAAAARLAGDCGAELVQDTAWPGYEQVPAWIVEGYATLLREVAVTPDLVVVPVGVGSLAQAVVAHYRSRRAGTAVLGVEPDTAACVLASLRAGRPRSVPTGGTVMAGLNCGTPSSLAWPVLRAGLDAAVAVPDAAALRAAADLGAHGVSSGPSGAAALAGARAALADPGRRAQLRAGPDATVLLLNTEGSTAG